MKLKDLKEKYLLYVQANFADGTFRCYKNHLDYTINYFKEIGIEDSKDLDSVDITKFIIYQRNKGISNSTINKRIGPLKRMLVYCHEELEGLEEIKKLKEKKVTFKYLSDDQLDKIIKYVDSGALSIQSELIIRPLLDTGMRPSELLRLKKRDINFDNNTILLAETKMDVERYVRFTNTTYTLLKVFTKDMKNNEVIIKLTYDGLKSIFARIKDKLDLAKFYPYMLRHTHATILVKNKAPIFYIQNDMGHTNVKTTERYCHLNFEDHQKIYSECFNY